jgi:DNA-directed RNA polymerase specialized sigma24 family protein
LSVREISEILKISESAVMKRMERGRKTLRKLMEENCHEIG